MGVAENVARFVLAADNLVNALATTITLHEGDNSVGREGRLLRAQQREAAAKDEYDAARLALLGDEEADEPESDDNLLD